MSLFIVLSFYRVKYLFIHLYYRTTCWSDILCWQYLNLIQVEKALYDLWCYQIKKIIPRFNQWCVKFFLERKYFPLPTDPKKYWNVSGNDNIFLSRLISLIIPCLPILEFSTAPCSLYDFLCSLLPDYLFCAHCLLHAMLPASQTKGHSLCSLITLNMGLASYLSCQERWAAKLKGQGSIAGLGSCNVTLSQRVAWSLYKREVLPVCIPWAAGDWEDETPRTIQPNEIVVRMAQQATNCC